MEQTFAEFKNSHMHHPNLSSGPGFLLHVTHHHIDIAKARCYVTTLSDQQFNTTLN